VAGCEAQKTIALNKPALAEEKPGDFHVVPVSPLAKIGNASRTMRKNGEVLKRGVFYSKVRRKPLARRTR
jgi:hypothetical protein